MAENNNMFAIPSLAASTAVLALLGAVSALVTFVWVFTSEANELRIANQETKFDQMNLREFAKEISENVKLNTIAIKANGEQIKANTIAIKANGEQIRELSLKVDGIEREINGIKREINGIKSDIKYIKCKIDNNSSENDCTELLDNQ